MTRILAFAYDFPHFKSAAGIKALSDAGFRDVVVIAAPWRKLDIAESPNQPSPVGFGSGCDVRAAARDAGYAYTVMAHEKLAEPGWWPAPPPQYGVILGARVLPPAIAERIPILNIHPGVLPANRGLDTIKWAVLDRLPQANTLHWIDRRVDRGAFVAERRIPVYAGDTPQAVYLRLMDDQIQAVRDLPKLGAAQFPIERGTYRRPMTPEDDRRVWREWRTYCRDYAQICAEYEARAA